MPNALGAIQTNLENSVISSRLRPEMNKTIRHKNKNIKQNYTRGILMLIPVPECDRELVDLLDDEFVVINDDAFTWFSSFLKLLK